MKSRTVIVLFALALSFIAAPVLAAGPYVGLEGGAVFLSTSKITFADNTPNADLKTKSGYAVGLVAGYDFGEYRLEGEFAYRKNDNKDITFAGSPTEHVSGDISTIALMVNGYYDFKMVSPMLYPYVGAGIGGARVKGKLIHQDTSTIASDSDTVFAYQLAAGIAYNVMKELTLDLGYKYFATAKPEFKEPDGVKVKGEYMSHNILLTARYNF